jgi:hypothetical protein
MADVVRFNGAASAATGQAAVDSRFPSEKHFDELKAKGFDGRRSDEDLWAWHAYDYGWRRIILQTRDDNSPIDPGRVWFNVKFAAEAEIFYARKFNKRAPDLGKARGGR